MKISQSTVDMQSWHASHSLRTESTRMRAWVGQQRPDFEGRNSSPSNTPDNPNAGVWLTLSAAARATTTTAMVRASAQAGVKNALATPTTTASPSATTEVEDPGRSALEPRMRVLMDMVKAITGQAVKVFDARALHGDAPAQTATPTPPPQAAQNNNRPEGWGVEIDTQHTLKESEITQVQAQGTVVTADGQHIAFTLNLSMQRAFEQTSETSLRAGDAVRKDPLVINFDGKGVELTNAQFAFDLEGDGQTESIAMVSGYSGFLVLDRNQDGVVNDGTELFGTRSGDGFADLAQYDQDGNQWIDANDAVFNQLSVWQSDSSGQMQQTTLADRGVGALYLGRVASPFSVNTATNQNLGQVRSTGLFLYESGLAGSLQQVDV